MRKREKWPGGLTPLGKVLLFGPLLLVTILWYLGGHEYVWDDFRDFIAG